MKAHTYRSFFAWPLDGNDAAELFRYARQLESAGKDIPGPENMNHLRLVRRENYHVTTVFLGNLEVLPLRQALLCLGNLQDSNPSSKILTKGSIRRFGSALALEISGSRPELETFHRSLASELDRAQIAFDHRPLRPHITLAYLKEKRGSGFKTPGIGSFEGRPLRLGPCALFISCSAPGGSIYRELTAASFEAILSQPF